MPESPQIGLEVCVAERPAALKSGARMGLLMNRASVNRSLQPACDVLNAAFPNQLEALFTPQHGWWGDAQANMIESPHSRHPGFDIPIHSLYCETRRPTAEMLDPLDCLVVDLQDVGTRVYTFVWTLLECLKACAQHGVSMVVLDRPNPLGRTVEGPLLESKFKSFVGGAAIPMRHGLTIGELALLLNREQDVGANLEVVPVRHWASEALFPNWRRLWTPPSPNLPRFESALVYPGQVLLEGANISEGRGTTTPFEVFGAPYIDAHHFSSAAQSLDLPGVRFMPHCFRPAFDKWPGELCGGVSLHVHCHRQFRPYQTSVALLALARCLFPEPFAWRSPPYEYEAKIPPIDIISGSSKLRLSIDRMTALDLEAARELAQVDMLHWKGRTRPIQLYGGDDESISS